MSRRWIVSLMFLVPLVIASKPLKAAVPALAPYPAKVQAGSGALAIDSHFAIELRGYKGPRLQAAASRTVHHIAQITGLPIESNASAQPVLAIECASSGAAIPALGEDESYQLEVTDQRALLKSATLIGALRGLATFTQLVIPGPNGFEVHAVRIEDKPRFQWRGLMLDVSRHWMPVDVVKRNLEAMAAVKLNVFHWHLSDDQGFRVESKRYPRLQELGSDGHFYTQQQVRDVIAFAADRGIRVVPEFDMPGHTTAWFTGYPELASAPGPYSIERKWGIFQPTMDPSRPDVFTFLDNFLSEMTALFPDQYFHIGGDELDDTQWKNSPAIRVFARERGLQSSAALETWFCLQLQQILRKYGKTMIGWDEILGPGLSNDAVIQSWRGQKALAESARKGYRGVLSFGYYLDHVQPAGTYYANEPLSGPASDLTGEQGGRILGGEACMWSEYVSPETVDSRIWPSMVAIAERFWSPRELTDRDSMYSRVERISRELSLLGLKHRENYLDRLTGGEPSSALNLLASVSEATGIEVRRDARHYTSQVPLNRFVDYVPPESETARRLMTADPKELRLAFAEWVANDTRVRALARDNSYIAELLPLSGQLAQAGSIGLEALDYIDAGRVASAHWARTQTEILDRLEKPDAEVVLAAVRPVKLLVSRAAHASAARH